METNTDKPIVIYGGPLFDGADRFWQDGALYISKGKIAALGSEEEVFQRIPKVEDLETYDCMGNLILPGLIDLHQHLYLSLARDYIYAHPAQNWSDYLPNTWWRYAQLLDQDTVQLAALQALLELIRNGVTTIFDLHSSPQQIAGSLESTAGAMQRAGLRSGLAYEISDRSGPEAFESALSESLDFLQKYDGSDGVLGLIGLSGNDSLSEDSLAAIVSRMPSDSGLHLHLAEEQADADFCREIGYKGSVDRLQQQQLLGPKTLLAGAQFLSPDEREQVSRSGAAIVQLPLSNLFRGLPILSESTMPEGTGGIGSDAFSSHPLQGLQYSYWTSQAQSDQHRAILNDQIKRLFQENSRIATRFFPESPGILRKDASADVVVYDYAPLSEISTDNLADQIVFGLGNRSAKLVIARGRILYMDGTYLTIDEEVVQSESRKAAALLRERFQQP